MIFKVKMKKILFALICIALPFSAFFVALYDFGFLNKATLFSASLVMPEGAYSVATNDFFENDMISDEVYSILQNSQISDISQPNLNISKGSDDELTKTPEDIAEYMNEYEGKKQSLSNDGTINEYQYSSTQANTVSGSVWVQNKTDQKIDIDQLLKDGADLKIEDKAQPTILIYHTHTTESYQPLDCGFFSKSIASRNGNNALNVVRVGDEITKQLEKAGYKVIHDKNTYDTTYSGAYYRSEERVRKYLEEYPSIKITLDIHRDAINSSTTMLKPTAVINGKKAAQIMIISGCEENGVVNFPDWKYNLKFALQLQKNMQETFPGLCRPLFFCDRVYNMNVNHCSLLIEIGTNANTLDEAAYSGRLLGVSLGKMLENYVQ
ncbi:MAG: stage II sporulation protein P [Clostridiales bacterium]|nr:stage II sporulation protein P [Clostridiales bacterium]